MRASGAGGAIFLKENHWTGVRVISPWRLRPDRPRFRRDPHLAPAACAPSSDLEAAAPGAAWAWVRVGAASWDAGWGERAGAGVVIG
eukprot:scaffold1097_cov66-Isochrysis_galbana.AAC.2